MTPLSERDVLLLEKLLTYTRAVQAVNQKGQASGQAPQSPQAAISPPTLSSSSTPHDSYLAGQRQWTNVCTIFWRLIRLRKLYIMAYLTSDPCAYLQEVFRCLANYLKCCYEAAPRGERVAHISRLAADHLLHVLQAFCSLQTCREMMASDPVAGTTLSDAVYAHIIQGGHLVWMTQLYERFCDETAQYDWEKKSMPVEYTHMMSSVLECLWSCCLHSQGCAQQLVRSEPVPYVISLLHGIRLRVLKASLLRPLVIQDVTTPFVDSEEDNDLIEDTWTGDANTTQQMASTYSSHPHSSDQGKESTHHAFDSLLYASLDVMVCSIRATGTYNHEVVLPMLGHFLSLSMKEVRSTGDSSICTETMLENILALLRVLLSLLHDLTSPRITCCDASLVMQQRAAVLHVLVEQDLRSSLRTIIYNAMELLQIDPSLFELLNGICTLDEQQAARDKASLASATDGCTTRSATYVTVIPSTDTNSMNHAGEGHWIGAGSLSGPHPWLPSYCMGPPYRDSLHDSFVVRHSSSSSEQSGVVSPELRDHSSVGLPSQSHQRLFPSFFTKRLWRKEHSGKGVTVGSEQGPSESAVVGPASGTSYVIGPWISVSAYVDIVCSIVEVMKEVHGDENAAAEVRLTAGCVLRLTALESVATMDRFGGRSIVTLFLRGLAKLLCGQTPSFTSTESESLASALQDTSVLATQTGYMHLTVSALVHVYKTLSMAPLISEAVALTRIVSCFVMADVAITHEVEVYFIRSLSLWSHALLQCGGDASLEEDARRVMVNVLETLLSRGSILCGVDGIPQGIQCIRLVACFPSAFRITASEEIESSHTELQEDAKSALCSIFAFLRRGRPSSLTLSVLSLLMSLLCSDDSDLSYIGERCLLLALDSEDAFCLLAGVLETASSWSSLSHIMPLLSQFVASEGVDSRERKLRRIWLMESGCVQVVIHLLQHALRCLHDPSVTTQFVPHVFHFLSCFEDPHEQYPSLSDLNFVSDLCDCVESPRDTLQGFVLAQSILDASTGNYPANGTSSVVDTPQRAQGILHLSSAHCTIVKPIFIELVPSVAESLVTVHDGILYANLIDVLEQLLYHTGGLQSTQLLTFVLSKQLSHLLPYLDIPSHVIEELPFVGTPQYLRKFWSPLLLRAPQRSEVRFFGTGGVSLHVRDWPEEGFTIAAWLWFSTIAPVLPLLQIFSYGGNSCTDGRLSSANSASDALPQGDTRTVLTLESNDCVKIAHHEPRAAVHELSATQLVLPQRWAHVCVTLSREQTMKVYIDGRAIGTCSVPCHLSRHSTGIEVGLGGMVIPGLLFALGDITCWSSELSESNVEAAIAVTGDQYWPQEGAKSGAHQQLSTSSSNAVLQSGCIAHFAPHVHEGKHLRNVSTALEERYVVEAVVSGPYAPLPKGWVDFPGLWVSRGGMMHMLEWFGEAQSETDVVEALGLMAEVVHRTQHFTTVDARTYLMFGGLLKANAHLVSEAACEKLLGLGCSFSPVTESSHRVITNRPLFDVVLSDATLYVALPQHHALYLLEHVKQLFSLSCCRHAKRNANFINPVRFVDLLLSTLLSVSETASVSLQVAVLSCIQHILLVCDMEASLVHVVTSFAAQLTPGEESMDASFESVQQITMPSLTCTSVKELTFSTALYMSYLALRCLVECLSHGGTAGSFSPAIDLQWYAACLVRFAHPVNVLYATHIFFSAVQCSLTLKEEVLSHSAEVVRILRTHIHNADLILLLLAMAIGATQQIDVLSEEASLLEQVGDLLCAFTPKPDDVLAPILTELVLHHVKEVMRRTSSPIASFFPTMGVPYSLQNGPAQLWRSIRHRKYWSALRICCRLMVVLHAQRYRNHCSALAVRSEQIYQKSRWIEESRRMLDTSVSLDASFMPPPFNITSMQTGASKGPCARYRKAFSALRACVLMWNSIQAKRSRWIHRETHARRRMLIARYGLPTATLFLLQTLGKLVCSPGMYDVLTSSCTQTGALSSLVYCIDREKMMRKMAEWGERIGNSTVYPLPDVVKAHAAGLGRHGAPFDRTSTSGQSKTLAPSAGQSKRNDRHTNVPILSMEHLFSFPSPCVEGQQGEDGRNEASTSTAVPKAQSGGVSKEGGITPFSALSDAGAAGILDTNTHIVVEGGSGMDATSLPAPPSRPDVSEGSVPSTEWHEDDKVHLVLLKQEALNTLAAYIHASLYTFPEESWAGGYADSSCSGLLFQMMAALTETPDTSSSSHTLLLFFLHEVAHRVREQALAIASTVAPSNTASTSPCAPPERSSHGISSDEGAGLASNASWPDVFLFNVSHFTEFVMDLLSMQALDLPTAYLYFLEQRIHCPSWPESYVDYLSRHIMASCIAVVNRLSVENNLGWRELEMVHHLSVLTLRRGWRMRGMLESLLRSLYRIYTSLPPVTMSDEEIMKRKGVVSLLIQHVVRVYANTTELRKALTSRSLTSRLSLHNSLCNALLYDGSTIGEYEMEVKEQELCNAFSKYCEDNAAALDMLMSGRPKAMADLALKACIKKRSDHVKRIKQYHQQLLQKISTSGKRTATELCMGYHSRFSSFVDTPPVLENAQMYWLEMRSCYTHGDVSDAAGTSVRPFYHTLDSHQNYAVVNVPRRCSWEPETPDAGRRAPRCEEQVHHVAEIVPCCAGRCRPFLLPSTSLPSFIGPRIALSPSAITLVAYLLRPHETLRYVCNGFRINGIYATPCLILLTNTTLRVIGFSKVTERGDIILCQSEESEAKEVNDAVLPPTSKSASLTPPSHQTNSPFSLATVTQQIQRLLMMDRGNRKRQLLRDGSRVAQSVRQSTSTSTYRSLYWSYQVRSISEVRCLRYMHLDTAVQLACYHDEGPMLSLVDASQSMNTSARSEFIRVLKEVLQSWKVPVVDDSTRTATLRMTMGRWAAGSVSNYEYISLLNRLAGRTTKDFNQYPVFPWVLADYTSSELDLSIPQTFRDFSYPMGAQTATRRQAVRNLFRSMQESPALDGYERNSFHHGTHYSTSGGVLYYLLRAEPYTTFARVFQGGEFDTPSRLFASIAATYASCVAGPADDKELVPQFYFNSAFLTNTDRLPLGVRPDGTAVGDVELPPWAQGSRQVFTAVMRYALECDHVTNRIHQWVDLVFGVCRRGPLAEERCNVFQQMTYGEDAAKALRTARTPHDCNVVIAEIDNFGQAPVQLFQERHPARSELVLAAKASAASTTSSSPLIRLWSSGSSANSSPKANIQTCAAANVEQVSTVMAMLAHAADEPQVKFQFSDPPPSLVYALPVSILGTFRGRGGSVKGFSLMSSLGKMAYIYPCVVPVAEEDYCICWNEYEPQLKRVSSRNGEFISTVPFESPYMRSMCIRAVAVGPRESVLLVGLCSGAIHCLFPTEEGSASCECVTLCHHVSPIDGLVLDSGMARAISYTSSGADPPVVWRVQRHQSTMLHQLNVASLLSSASTPLTHPEDHVVVSACTDSVSGITVLITKRSLLLFDVNGEPYGAGFIPPAAYQEGDATLSVPVDNDNAMRTNAVQPQPAVFPMTCVVAYHTQEWCAGTQLYLTGHQDGGVGIWRSTRLPPDIVRPGQIVVVQFRNIIKTALHAHHDLGSSGSQELGKHLGAVSSVWQASPDTPRFWVGYQSGDVKTLFFDPWRESTDSSDGSIAVGLSKGKGGSSSKI